MPAAYVPIFIYLVVALAFVLVLLMVAKVLRPSAPQPVKLEAYECGVKALSNARGRYTIRFYIVAILFVIFDVETIFLYPWAVRYKQLGWFGVAEVAVFLAILVVGYVWAYKKDALKWVYEKQHSCYELLWLLVCWRLRSPLLPSFAWSAARLGRCRSRRAPMERHRPSKPTTPEPGHFR